MNELVIRYALPGLPLAIVLFVAEQHVAASATANSFKPVLDVALLLALSVLLGNVLQQLWMLIFEFLPVLAYDSRWRPVLRDLANGNQEPGGKKLYVKWETILYSANFPSELREKDRQTWHFFHANAGNVLGLGGSAALAASFLHLGALPSWFRVIGWICGIVAALFIVKAYQTWALVSALERHWLKEWQVGRISKPTTAA